MIILTTNLLVITARLKKKKLVDFLNMVNDIREVCQTVSTLYNIIWGQPVIVYSNVNTLLKVCEIS